MFAFEFEEVFQGACAKARDGSAVPVQYSMASAMMLMNDWNLAGDKR